MNRAPGLGVDVTVGIDVGDKGPVDLYVSRASGDVVLSIGANVAEIRLDRVHARTLAERIPAVLADLDQVDIDNATRTSADEARHGAMGLLERLLDEAANAEHTRATKLRTAADELVTAMAAVNQAMATVGETVDLADEAAEEARQLLAGRTDM